MANIKLGKRLFFCIIVFLIVLSPILVSAETAAERYERLQDELQDTRTQISQQKNDISATQSLMTSYEKEKEIIDEMVALNKEEIDRISAELEQLQAEIAVSRQFIYENDQLLQDRLIAIFNMNNSSALSQLLNIDSFSEVFIVTDAMRRISQNDSELLEQLSSEKLVMEEEQFAIDSLLANMTSYHAELVYLQDGLVENIMALDDTLSREEAELRAQQEIEGDQFDAAAAAYNEMQNIGSNVGGSSNGDGSDFVGGSFTWPVPGYYGVSCEFGQPDPNGTPHRGMDVPAPQGTSIRAVGSGTVIVAASSGSYGNYIVIDHGNGVKTLYAHCHTLDIGVGSYVSTGQHIATVGTTGFSTGNHLHLEVQNNGSLENPRNWLSG